MTNSGAVGAQLWRYLKVRKKFSLLLVTGLLLLVGALVVFAEGSALAPFIYTVF